MDIVAPGVPNRRLARFARAQGFVGVGEYPRSGFVHVDVRERSYFWVDSSGPGQRSRERRVRLGEARRHDARARDRGEDVVVDVADSEDTPGAAPAVDERGADSTTVTARAPSSTLQP